MEHSERVRSDSHQKILPWLVTAGALLVYLVTLNHWITIASTSVVATVTGWDWWSVGLQIPLFYLLTYPIRWLPAAWQPVGLNVFTAVCAAATLGLLARSVMLLPHNRTKEQRQRERSEHSLLSIPTAWIPPLLAVLALGFQRTFWENATVATSEMLNVLLFSYVIRCLLEYRVDPRDSWLYRLAFVYGLSITNNWGMIGFFPLFLVAFIWILGRRFFDLRFILKMTGFGILGLSLYLLLPLTYVLQGGEDYTFWGYLKMSWGMQRYSLLTFPKYIVLLAGLTSLLPVLVIGIRWPSTFGDVSILGTTLTNIMFRVVHALFLVACAWVLFDPPFSPRILGKGYPLLTLYYLSALSLGYFSGYFLLVFGVEPERRRHHASALATFGKKAVAGLVMLSLIVLPAALIYRNWPVIKANNGADLARLSESLVKSLPAKEAFVLSDSSIPLFLVEAHLARTGVKHSYVMLDTRFLPYPTFHHRIGKQHPGRWPTFLTERKQKDPINPLLIAQLLSTLARTNTLHYLHPCFNHNAEGVYGEPQGMTYLMKSYVPGAVLPPPPNAALITSNNAFWEGFKQTAKSLTRPLKKAQGDLLISDSEYVSRYFSRAANHWGVELQRNSHVAEADELFNLALELNPDNYAAKVNHDFNGNLRKGQLRPIEVDPLFENKRTQAYQSIEILVQDNGPFDEPRYCALLGESLALAQPFPYVRLACQQFLRVKALEPSNMEARIWLANMYLKWPLPNQIIDLVTEMRDQESVIPLSPAYQIELYRLEALAYASSTNLPKAEKIIKEAQQKFPGEESLPDTLAQIYLRASQFTNALAAVEQTLKINPKNTKALLNKSALCIKLGLFSDAIPPLNQVLQVEPANDAARMNRAIAQLRSGDMEGAKQDYEKLLELLPDSQKHAAHFGLARIAEQQNQVAKAIEHYEEYLDLVPVDSNKEPVTGNEAKEVKERLRALRSGEKPQ